MESASVRTRGQTPACARMRCGVARIVDGLDDGLDGLDDGFDEATQAAHSANRARSKLASRILRNVTGKQCGDHDQVIRKTRQAGAPKNRQMLLSVRHCGGWSRTPVHSSGTSALSK